MTTYTASFVIPEDLLVLAPGPEVNELLDIWCDISDAADTVTVATSTRLEDWANLLTLTGPADDVRPISTRLMTWLLTARKT